MNSFPSVSQNQLTDEPIILEGMIEGHQGCYNRGQNTNDCYQLKNQIEEAVALGKLAHLVKDIHWNNQRNGSQVRNNVKVINMIRGEGSHKRPFEGERKEQNGANGVCYNKMSFSIQHHNRKDQNEKPQSEKLCRNIDSWKGCKVSGR
nr:hypothetical protein [Tanacetum cinerariifolium]